MTWLTKLLTADADQYASHPKDEARIKKEEKPEIKVLEDSCKCKQFVGSDADDFICAKCGLFLF